MKRINSWKKSLQLYLKPLVANICT